MNGKRVDDQRERRNERETKRKAQRETERETEKRKSLDLFARFAREMHPHMGPLKEGERPKESSERAAEEQQKSSRRAAAERDRVNEQRRPNQTKDALIRKRSENILQKSSRRAAERTERDRKESRKRAERMQKEIRKTEKEQTRAETQQKKSREKRGARGDQSKGATVSLRTDVEETKQRTTRALPTIGGPRLRGGSSKPLDRLWKEASGEALERLWRALERLWRGGTTGDRKREAAGDHKRDNK